MTGGPHAPISFICACINPAYRNRLDCKLRSQFLENPVKKLFTIQPTSKIAILKNKKRNPDKLKWEGESKMKLSRVIFREIKTRRD